MTRTKQECRKLSQSNPSLVSIRKKKYPSGPPFPNAVPLNLKLRRAVPVTVSDMFRKAAPPTNINEVFNCNEMTREDAVETVVPPSRELEDAAVRALASVFDCSQL